MVLFVYERSGYKSYQYIVKDSSVMKNVTKDVLLTNIYSVHRQIYKKKNWVKRWTSINKNK